jgi:dolichol-phosphate mannosyltransferase
LRYSGLSATEDSSVCKIGNVPERRLPVVVNPKKMLLSVVIPAKDEEGCVEDTISTLTETLSGAQIPYEILVVDDGSTDTTADRVRNLAAVDSGIRLIENRGRHGFGLAVRKGLEHFTGDCVAVFMADASDSPDDLVRYYRAIEEGYDCAFGSRFMKGGRIIDYPRRKLLLNRLANKFVSALFRLQYNDVTNAFKCYRREVIEHMQPLISPHFNLTVEMPLKAIVRGFSFRVTPITWTNRQTGVSKLKIKEMGSRYLFIVLYLWLEKYLSRGDYHRPIPISSDVPAEVAGVVPHPRP